ncbi:MAG: UDP-N-acetylglucosamine--N-acetylmuramyl-(pentapeptide) pyrophosphoryl-undecaprenol N-acetylglucosamine transferase [Treponema sp.]|nr:UDP-N-acetylglucosamine--N-acetylmuramyl-(pentapeptide) pyrophosphoryl-undecaprenol N-acetylglucosamine transferase [Treponema sp.]
MVDAEKSYSIVFAGGGSGGHIYPGIAVADALKILAKERGIDVRIHWIGNKSGIDRGIVEKNLVSEGGSIDSFYGISCGKLRRYITLKNFSDLFKIAAGYFQSKKILKKLSPDTLFSKGGFVSVTPCRAARSLRIPYYTHECDFTPGLATKLNSRGAKNILVSYMETEKYFSGDLKDRCIVTGNPVRPVFYEDNREAGLEFLGIKNNTKPVLLVLGGSLGARQINNLVTENIDWLTERFEVVHQTGAAFAETHPEVFSTAKEGYHPYTFIYSQMPSVIQAADVILSRAGANSLWECAVSSKPMVLVPLCGSGTRGDQVDNARYFESVGAAKALIGEDASSNPLKKALESLLPEEERRKFSDGCKKICGSSMPARRIAEIILDGLTK